MKDLTSEIRIITSKYGMAFIAKDDFLDMLKSLFPKKDAELNQKLFVYTVLRDEKVLSQIIALQKKDIPKYINREISYLSEKYCLEEYILQSVFKELLVGSGIAQERDNAESSSNNGQTAIPKGAQRLRSRMSKSTIKLGKIDKRRIYCIVSIIWAIIFLFFLPLIPASMDNELDMPGIIPSILHYIMSIVPLLFVLTSSKQSQANKSMAAGVLTCIVVFAGMFLSFGFFHYPYQYEYDTICEAYHVGQLISDNLGVMIVSMISLSLFSLFFVYVFNLIKEQEFSEIINVSRQNKRIFLFSLAFSTILVISVGFIVLKYSVVGHLVGIMGEFVANVCMWVMIVLVVLIILFAYV